LTLSSSVITAFSNWRKTASSNFIIFYRHPKHAWTRARDMVEAKWHDAKLSVRGLEPQMCRWENCRNLVLKFHKQEGEEEGFLLTLSSPATRYCECKLCMLGFPLRCFHGFITPCKLEWRVLPCWGTGR
jgi:hypothetical protein